MLYSKDDTIGTIGTIGIHSGNRELYKGIGVINNRKKRSLIIIKKDVIILKKPVPRTPRGYRNHFQSILGHFGTNICFDLF